MKRLGLDVGSTTLKCVVINEENSILYSTYERHYSRVSQAVADLLLDVFNRFSGESMEVSVSGSAGMGIANLVELPFIQEVHAAQIAVKHLNPNTDVVIELGGEDAKILFLSGGFEMRMNGTCAGGTGAFIDQMATLMNLSPNQMDVLASQHEKVYTIASRCGVFAKSDIQPLLNQGARKADVSASIFYAVVNQTIAGLAQGREIKGNVLYLGGPLTFLAQLRQCFNDVLHIEGTCPEESLYYVALGAAYAQVGKVCSLDKLAEKISITAPKGTYHCCAPLFSSQDEYELFLKRHQKASEGIHEIDYPNGPLCLGIDAGSTTVKAVLCDEAGNIFRPAYAANNGNPIPFIKEYLERLYADYPDIEFRSAAVTGYGEEIVRSAFHIDHGIVETIAHYTAAKRFRPDVDFILDIGGQDIKCFQIRNEAIDNIYLNEACSSGCGSFLQTFAGALGYTVDEFAKLGLFAEAPVDLGSRCTVFMNSAVKQAQKDGASIENIAAGLSISVVKNALYKVIRCTHAEQLGKNIVVQGGTFLNDSVLRAFEQEIGQNVIRPKYAELMGAYGAALYAWECAKEKSNSTILSADELRAFQHTVKTATCRGCGNHCNLTLNTFGSDRRYIAGNRCEKHIPSHKEKIHYDLYDYKLKLLEGYCKNELESGKLTIGIPLGLNLYELLPFWYTFFKDLGFNVLVSPLSTRELYLSGQHTIPSDTICYPAKLMHGHIEALLAQQPDAIFYPDMSYNLEEGLGVNHFNCPVVAYYPQVLKSNVLPLQDTTFIYDFIGLHDRKQFAPHIKRILDKYFEPFSKAQIHHAAKKAYDAYDHYMEKIRSKAEEYLEIARVNKLPVIVLAGRPYHIDPEINHGINALICKQGAVVLTEDSVSHKVCSFPTDVRNQWTYHARLYAAAKFVADAPEDINVNLIQLVSFGCGVDAITTDEARAIIEKAGKIYTQIKIDEISNMGAVNIRLRSLFSAIQKKSQVK